MVEHTSINPNKAAHIGHLRNAVLGDTFARMLRYAGRRVEVQNYIDNTGVQVADVVLGFLHLEPKSLDEVRALTASAEIRLLLLGPLRAGDAFLAEDKSRLELRAQTLKDIEEGHGEAAQMAEIVSTAIVHCHLRTLDRLGIDYDLLSRESEILHLKFWDAAFEMLKQRGAIQFATSGKNAGCWVMELPSDQETKRDAERRSRRKSRRKKPKRKSSCARTARSLTSAKISRTTSGNLGCWTRDFHYRRFTGDPDGHEALGHHERNRRAGRAGVRPRARSVQRDRFAAGVSAAGGGRRIARRSDTTEAGRPSEAFCLQRGGAHAALRPRNGLRNSAGGREEALHRSQRAQRPGREGGRPARPARSERAQGSGRAASGYAGSGARGHRARHCHRRAALFSAALHALDGDRL